MIIRPFLICVLVPLGAGCVCVAPHRPSTEAIAPVTRRSSPPGALLWAVMSNYVVDDGKASVWDIIFHDSRIWSDLRLDDFEEIFVAALPQTTGGRVLSAIADVPQVFATPSLRRRLQSYAKAKPEDAQWKVVETMTDYTDFQKLEQLRLISRNQRTNVGGSGFLDSIFERLAEFAGERESYTMPLEIDPYELRANLFFFETYSAGSQSLLVACVASRSDLLDPAYDRVTCDLFAGFVDQKPVRFCFSLDKTLVTRFFDNYDTRGAVERYLATKAIGVTAKGGK